MRPRSSGRSDIDFLVFDQEHSPFDRVTIDMMVLAARASNIAGMVRVGDPSDGNILGMLDCGAAGMLVPHVDSADKAQRHRDRLPLSGRPARLCQHHAGRRLRRGVLCGSQGRAGFASHLHGDDRGRGGDRADRRIAAVPGIDAFFVGRGDLTAAIGAPSMTSPRPTGWSSRSWRRRARPTCR